ncbi:MAG: DUF4430 domain-containing protein [Candidatus Bathyarchaeia archaeon]
MKRAQTLLFIIAVITVSVVAAGLLGQTSNDHASEVKVRVVVTKDYGAELILDREVEMTKGATVIDALREVAKVETAYGGGFVNAINDIRSEYTGTGVAKRDWFIYINGVLADVGGADYRVEDDTTTWWDFHDWDFHTFITAAVGLFPEPFLHGYKGKVCETIIIYEDELLDEAMLLNSTLTECGVRGVSILKASELSREDRESPNLIILGTIKSPLISELNGIYQQLGFYIHYEGDRMLVLNSSGELAAEYSTGGMIQATQNPWNPKGTMAGESVVWVLSGINEDDVNDVVEVLISSREELAHAFAATVVEGQVSRVPPC